MTDPIYFLSPTNPGMGGGGSSIFQPGVEEGVGIQISGSNLLIDPGTIWLRGATSRALTPHYVNSQITKALPALPSGANLRVVSLVVAPSAGGTLAASDFTVYEGTDSTTATLDNRTNAHATVAGASTTRPTITGGGQLLYDVLQSSSTRTGRDRRPWATGAFAIATNTSGDTATNGTGWSDANVVLRQRVEVGSNGQLHFIHYFGGNLVAVTWTVDGTRTDYSSEPYGASFGTGQPSAAVEGFALPTPGSHLIRPQYKNFDSNNRTTGAAVSVVRETPAARRNGTA